MTLNEYISTWATDSQINPTKMLQESLEVPRLHAKYLAFLSIERKKFRKLQQQQVSFKSKLIDYYTGVIDGKDIGKPPHQITETKASAERKADVDVDYVKINLALIEQEEIVLFLKEVVTSINKRSFDIKNHIDYLKFTNGTS